MYTQTMHALHDVIQCSENLYTGPTHTHLYTHLAGSYDANLFTNHALGLIYMHQSIHKEIT